MITLVLRLTVLIAAGFVLALTFYRYQRLEIARRKRQRELQEAAAKKESQQPPPAQADASPKPESEMLPESQKLIGDIAFFGKPTSGKGTVAAGIAKEYGFRALSTGDLLRAAIAAGTPLGLVVEERVKAGLLVDDDLVLGVTREALDKRKTIFDGIPRRRGQAVGLDKVEAESGRRVLALFYLKVPDDDVRERSCNRRQCRDCKRIYNLVSDPPRSEGICDACGGELYQRDDDTLETVNRRLEEFRPEEGPICDYYRETGRLFVIDASNARGRKAVLAEVLEIIEKLEKEKAQ